MKYFDKTQPNASKSLLFKHWFKTKKCKLTQLDHDYNLPEVDLISVRCNNVMYSSIFLHDKLFSLRLHFYSDKLIDSIRSELQDELINSTQYNPLLNVYVFKLEDRIITLEEGEDHGPSSETLTEQSNDFLNNYIITMSKIEVDRLGESDYSYDNRVALNYLIHKNYAQLESILQPYIGATSNNIWYVYYLLGESFFQRAEYTKAGEFFLRSLKYNEHNPNILLRLGQALASIGTPSAADEKKAACLVFSQIETKFRRASTNVKQEILRERMKLGC